jgi:type I restriction enzyme, R subunit
MPGAPSFREALISQIPALQLLIHLGYSYLSPERALAARGGRSSEVLLDDILARQLARINRFQARGRSHQWSADNIRRAVQRLKDERYDGLIATNERVYNLLTLGISLPETIDGDTKSYTLNYIDWQHPENNVFHVTDEFTVERRVPSGRSRETRRPDLVLFVNGIPLVVIECKRPDLGRDKALTEGVEQLLKYQAEDEIPQLFVFSQLLLMISTNDALYATTKTPKEFWSVWREEADTEAAIQRLINQRLDQVGKYQLYGHRPNGNAIAAHFDALEQAGERLPTVQDRAIYHLLRPQRLLDLIYGFIVYDAGAKKIARYQQYFAIKATLAQVSRRSAEGTRAGGVIWHTTGSGKSLTMVMLAKALTLQPGIADPRVMLVTDRVDLDRQIWGTFHACGKLAARARSGKELARLIADGKAALITTVINKFEAAARQGARSDSDTIFVLVDESHRTQYGSFHAHMRQVFPNACYIGFTGTPLKKPEKSTARRFGGFIHTYTMQQAVDDKAVVPLLYEGRMAELGVNSAAIDQWFERVTARLTEEQKRDLKRKFSRSEEISAAEQRIQQIAYDITRHYVDNLRGSGRKAQLAVASKASALRYKRQLDEWGEVKAEVVISPPDMREGSEQSDETQVPEVQRFWQRIIQRFRSEEAYTTWVREQFASEDGIELLIVVDKLLTGFDEPRNTVLYIDKPLKEHSLLQAIARVNRLFAGKDFGLVIDYRGVLGELNAALNTYSALAEFDRDDVENIVVDVRAEIERLPALHAALWGIFAGAGNTRDPETMQRHLEPQDRRQAFYAALSDFARSLKVALGTIVFYQDTPAATIATYKHDFKSFHSLRQTVQRRFGETIDYGDYEQRIRGLIDKHIDSSEVVTITRQVNIFDAEAFAAEVARMDGAAARADTIANHVKRTLTERIEQDPAAYRRFSQMIDDTIRAYREGRLTEAEYLAQVSGMLQQIQSGAIADVPDSLISRPDARAFWGVLRELPLSYNADNAAPVAPELLAEIALRLDAIIVRHKVRDWTRNLDVQNTMRNAIEDDLYELRDQGKLTLSIADIDRVLDAILELARQRERIA